MVGEFWRKTRAGKAALVSRVPWFKSIILAETVLFLCFALALTVAPQITLSAVADTLARARDFSLGHRPVVATFGLLLVAATTACLWALVRAPRSDAAPPATVRENGRAGKTEKQELAA